MADTPILSAYFTRSELATELQITDRTLDRWFTERTGPPATRLGRRRLYHREDVERWLREQRQEMPARKL